MNQTAVTRAEIEAKVDHLLKQSTGKRVGMIAKSSALLGLLYSPLAYLVYEDLKETKQRRDMNNAINEGMQDLFNDLSSHIFGEENVELDYDYLEQGVDGNWRRPEGYTGSNTPPKETSTFLDNPKATAIGLTALATAVTVGIASYRSFKRHDKATKALKEKYTEFAENNPDYKLPTNEEILKDYARVRKWGSKILEDKNKNASSSPQIS